MENSLQEQQLLASLKTEFAKATDRTVVEVTWRNSLSLEKDNLLRRFDATRICDFEPTRYRDGRGASAFLSLPSANLDAFRAAVQTRYALTRSIVLRSSFAVIERRMGDPWHNFPSGPGSWRFEGIANATDDINAENARRRDADPEFQAFLRSLGGPD